MSKYTVNQIAKSAGVSVRTLHHYHEIGLLVPRHVAANGYRYYDEAEALRLQQIMLYRGFGMGLSEIKSILDAPNFSALTALQRHKVRLEAEAKRLPQLIRTIDRTIEALKGDRDMIIDKLYKAFPPEKQADYEAELVKSSAGMAAKVASSKAHMAGKSAGDRQADMHELHDIEAAIITNMRNGLPFDAPGNAMFVARHRAWVSAMWGRECTPDAHIGLAQMYEAHPDFNQRYESLAEGFTTYICATIRAHSR